MNGVADCPLAGARRAPASRRRRPPLRRAGAALEERARAAKTAREALVEEPAYV